MNQKGFAIGTIMLLIVLITSTLCTGVSIHKDQVYGSDKEVTVQYLRKDTCQNTVQAGTHVVWYFADFLVQYIKTHFTGLYYHSFVIYKSGILCLNANQEELTLSIVMNYTAEMNYSVGIPFPAPIIAFGLKIENNSEYTWRTLKLKHMGYEKQEGNISFNISLDMEHIKPGDKILLRPTAALVNDPNLYVSKDHQYSKESSRLLRIIYCIPALRTLVLENWLFTFIAEHGLYNLYGEDAKLILLFQ